MTSETDTLTLSWEWTVKSGRQVIFSHERLTETALHWRILGLMDEGVEITSLVRHDDTVAIETDENAGK